MEHSEVASFTDAWIETVLLALINVKNAVASFTDAWIETVQQWRAFGVYQSHLLQMRGLKQ